MESPTSGDERRAQEVVELMGDSESTSAKNDEGDTNEDLEGTGEDDEIDEDASSSLSAGDHLVVRSILSSLFFSNNHDIGSSTWNAC
jgi:hypothetical protein